MPERIRRPASEGTPAIEPRRPGTPEALHTAVVSRQDGPSTVVRISGEIDILSCSDLERCLTDQLAARSVVLNFRGVTFLGTSGLQVLLTWLDKAEAAGVPVALVVNSADVMRPLSIAGIETRVVLCTTEQEATALFLA